MSKIAIKGATTGTGVFTLESPATNTDRTLILPDEAGTVLTSAGRPLTDALNNLYLTAVTTTTQVISSNPTVILWSSTYNPNSLYSPANGRFTVDSNTAGTFLILVDITAYSLQSPGGVSFLETKIRKNGSDVSVRLIEESTNPDETTAGSSHALAISLSAGDYIDVTAFLSSTSGAKNLNAGSSLTVVKLF